MNKTLLALGIGIVMLPLQQTQAAAHERCLDAACMQHSLFHSEEPASAPGPQVDSAQAPRFGEWGIDLAGMDRSVSPGDDFGAYVNGNWNRTTQIPADRSRFGAFDTLRVLSEQRLRRQLDGYALGNPVTGGDAAKIAAVYRSFLDEAAVEKAGAKPLQPLLDEITAISDKSGMAASMGRAMGGFGGTFFAAFVGDDQKNPDVYTLYLNQSGLGLGDREMYRDAKFAPQRERYVQYIEQMLALAGWPEPKRNAAAIMDMEMRIADAHWSRADSRDRDKTYNPLKRAEFAAFAPGFDWQAFFAAAGVEAADTVVIRQNTAMPPMARIFQETPLETLKAWQAFRTTDAAAPLLSKAFADTHFAFRDKFISGQPEQRERWKRAVAFAENAMGEAVGRDYVALYFPAESKAKMDVLVANVKAAMGARLRQLDWMSPETKREALAKLDGFGLKIGHPEKWRDYSGLQVKNGDLFGNALAAQGFEWDYRRARIGKPVDKVEWGMTPQTVNAYYNSVKNEIVFPAAILQPPFFDPNADDAVNYGAIGGVIGHEIIHGFDDQGRKSDGKGMLRDWWSAEDARKFEAQAAKLGAQYEAVEFPQLPGMHINGKVAMGENIGDLGGLTIALEAYRRSLNGKPAPVIDGFSGEQRLFMGWAQVWRTLYRDDALRQQLVNGPHSPGQIRAYAPLRNIDAWYEAFDVKPGDALYVKPEDRVRIW